MNNNRNNGIRAASGTRRLVGIALFAALVAVLQIVGGWIRIGTFSFSLVLIPIVVGGAVYGRTAGAVLGGVFGLVVTINTVTGADAYAYILFSARPVITVLLCMGKGILAGWIAAVVYHAMAKKAPMLGVILAALVCPIVNTGIFCGAMVLFFREILQEWAGGTSAVYFMLFTLVGINFLIEVMLNVIFCPALATVIKVGKKA